MYQSFLKEGCAMIAYKSHGTYDSVCVTNYQLKVENSEQWEA